MKFSWDNIDENIWNIHHISDENMVLIFFLNIFMISVWSNNMTVFFTSVIFVVKLHQQLSFLDSLSDF